MTLQERQVALPIDSRLIGVLPRSFLVAAFVNFLVGASLGGWMAAKTASWGFLASLHGEINPFGWLTMMIYGMTYAVLAISAGLHPPKRWVGWAHFVCAEAAVVMIVGGFAVGAEWAITVGLGLQFAAPLFFLINILSAVVAGRRRRMGAGAEGNAVEGTSGVGGPAAGLLAMESQAVASQTVGSQTVGSQTVGSQTVGSQTVGSQTVGSQTVGVSEGLAAGVPTGEATLVATGGSLSVPEDLAFLQKSDLFKSTDRIGQRGTDAALMLYLLATAWMFGKALAAGAESSGSGPAGALFIVYYGWIAGTVLSVALHLFPRFTDQAKVPGQPVSIGQILWGFGVGVSVVGNVVNSDLLEHIGWRITGLALAWFGVFFLVLLWRATQARGDRHNGGAFASDTNRRTDTKGATDAVSAADGDREEGSYVTPRGSVRQWLRMPGASRFLWVFGWLGCFALGCALVFGLNPLSLTALHLLFLVFTTSLVYGIGYALFPRILRRNQPSRALTFVQALLASIGSTLMVIAFSSIQTGAGGGFVLLAVGGTAAALAAIVFLVGWAVG